MEQESVATPAWAEGLRQADVLADDEFLLSETVAVWDFVDEAPGSWSITTRPLVEGGPPKRCSATSVLIVAGLSSTFNGRRELLVSEFICPTQIQFAYESPAILLATAVGQEPVFVTTGIELPGASNRDLRLRFFSWNAAGQPAPRVSFRWHLTAAAIQLPP